MDVRVASFDRVGKDQACALVHGHRRGHGTKPPRSVRAVYHAGVGAQRVVEQSPTGYRLQCRLCTSPWNPYGPNA